MFPDFFSELKIMSNSYALIVPPVLSHSSKRTSCDCPRKLFHFKIYSPNQEILCSNDSFSIRNDKTYFIPPKKFCNIVFNVTVETSIPAVCILSCYPLLRYMNIFHQINTVQTNDTYLNITLFNNNDSIFELRGVQVNCNIIVGNIT